MCGETKALECFTSARFILWILIFLGFTLNAMVQMNINIAIVAMVQLPLTYDAADAVNHTRECHSNDDFNVTSSVNHTNGTLNGAMATTFNWNEHEKNLVLGSFYWLCWPFPIVGGLLTQRYGTKLVFGISNFASCFLTFFIPFAAYWSIEALIFIRVLQGFISSAVWSSIHNLVGNWIPPTERSRFFSSTSGYSLGIAATSFISSQLIHSFGWPSVFYFSGVCSIVWYIPWALLVFDTPSKHPRISKAELEYIIENVKQTEQKKTFQVPWKHILLSVPVWMNVIAMWGASCCLALFIIHIPTYLNEVHGWSIRMNGFLSGAPHLFRVLSTYTISAFFDFFLKKGIMSTTGVRKLATATCTIGPGVLVTIIAFSGCDKTSVIVCMLIAMLLCGVYTSGPVASFADLSPNYSSVLMGISVMVNMTIGIMWPPIVAALTYQNHSVKQWQIIFLLTAAFGVLSGIVYLLFASSELQEWNSFAEPAKSLKEHAQTENKKTIQPLLAEKNENEMSKVTKAV